MSDGLGSAAPNLAEEERQSQLSEEVNQGVAAAPDEKRAGQVGVEVEGGLHDEEGQSEDVLVPVEGPS